MLNYYLNMLNNTQLSFDAKIKVAEGILRTANRSFEPFEIYLRNIIDVLEKKEEIKANWKKVDSKNRAQLSMIGGLYEIPKKTVINVSEREVGYYRVILKEGDNPDFNETLRYKAGSEKGEVSVLRENFQDKQIKLPIAVETFDKVIWGFCDVNLEPAWTVFQKGTVLKDHHSNEYTVLSVDGGTLALKGELTAGTKLFYQDKEVFYSVDENSRMSMPQGVTIVDANDRRVIYSEKKIPDSNEIKEIKSFESYITNDVFHFETGGVLDAERDGWNLLLKNGDDYDKIVTANHIKFRIERIHKKSNEAFRIQLIEIDESNKEDDVQTLSPLRHFFDDDINIEDAKKNQYYIIDGREAEYTLILKSKTENKPCFPVEENGVLKVKVNTYPLRKQLEAIATLKNMPAADHASLIKLFENRNDPNVKWDFKDNTSLPDCEWSVITDTNRSGYEKQREFVNKALRTQDFAILEGPPGSGKTTVILELICQLAKRNKRVLLCGSTHVAIDNILERLKKKTGEESLLEKIHILPVRIGEENRINEDVREFQIGKLKEDGIDEDLLLDAANLVCGTTIGILQHPKFKSRKGNLYKNKSGKYQYYSDTPIIPEFDYLIIDESSKTTFQEFLVPALYAKRWILAGDIMQLSPFAERGDIVSNLEYLIIDGKQFSKSLQYAVFYLWKLRECVNNRKDCVNNKLVLPVSTEIIRDIHSELICGKDGMDDYKNKVFLFITKSSLKNDDDHILIRKVEEINFLEMAVADIIFVDEKDISRILPHLPECHAVLRLDSWDKSEHAFIHNAHQKTYTFSHKGKGEQVNDSFNIVERINGYFNDKNWAEEVAWRIDREHQLRLVEKDKIKRRYTEQIEDLLPRTLDREKAEEAVNGVAEMAFPSILESLVRGIKGRKTKVESAVSEGFKPYDLEKRKTTLVYQHRMHSEISKFPRERFYKSAGALKDLEKPNHIDELRKWAYAGYPSRCVWVNVDGVTYRNRNEREVEVLMEHLKKFIQYAKNNKHPENKPWDVACLTFYRGQEKIIREKLQALCKKENGISNFSYTENNVSINIKLHTVDKFQGHEADVVFLSMVQTTRTGFMDNPNRLNVAITRAKFQLVVFGKHDYFSGKIDKHNIYSEDLKEFANAMPLYKSEEI